MATQIQPTPIIAGKKAKMIIDQITSVEASVETEKGKQILFKMFGNMEKDGFDYYVEDELGGVHTDGVGYAPDGHFCGECTRESCVGCWDKKTEQGKQNIKALFQDKEQYYKLSTLYDLAYEDDVNGNCDGRVDVGVVASLTSADVEPVRHGEWICKTNEHNYFEFHCSLCGRIEEKEEPYCHCGAKMDGGK